MPPNSEVKASLETERQQRETQIERVHERIDEVLAKLDNMTSLLTWNNTTQLPGVLPRLKALEDQHEAERAAANARTMKAWAFEMGTYVIKVLLAAFALYIASSAHKGIATDLVKQGSSWLLGSRHDRVTDCTK